jgi:hypothetical protein
MKTSNYVSKYLSATTQAAFAASKAGGNDEGGPKEKEVEAPSSPNIQLLKKVQRLVFGPGVKDLQEARSKFLTILESLDDEEREEVKKKPEITE